MLSLPQTCQHWVAWPLITDELKSLLMTVYCSPAIEMAVMASPAEHFMVRSYPSRCSSPNVKPTMHCTSSLLLSSSKSGSVWTLLAQSHAMKMA